MRTPALLALIVVATPALAFDEKKVSNPAALSGVERVFVAPVALDLPAATGRFERRHGGIRPVLPRDAEARAEALTADLKRGFRRDFELADGPGPGVLVIEPTLTRLEASRPTMADFQQEPGLGFESTFAGGASVTLRLLRDGEEVAVLKDRYAGNFSDGQPRIGIWQDADRAFSRWSRTVPAFVAQPQTAGR